MLSLLELFLWLVVAALVLLVAVSLVAAYNTRRKPDLVGYEEEQTFYNTSLDCPEGFPSLDDRGSKLISVIVPAYNEQKRLPTMLDECTRFFENRIRKDRAYNYEIILVDDGSKDETSKLGITYTRKLGTDKFRVLTLKQNRGKGGAVRLGMLRARGKTLLFADADGATKFEDLAKLEDKLHEMIDKQKEAAEDTDLAIVCGSRAHLEDESIATRSLFRTFLMKGFHFCVSMFGASSVRDTQCGFKLMTRGAARICFKSLHIERWAFDVELIKIAEMVGIPVTEVAVRWHEVDGSKLDPVSASVQMFKDLFLLWLRYRLGVWQIAKQD